jgi:MoaA/NifB/PqqE/SkfB family radical SAM enzyme
MAKEKTDVFDFLQNRILTHYPAAVKIRNREMPAPRTAIVYPTYICNQDCTWCEYRAENSEHHSIMKTEDFAQLMKDLADLGVRGVEFCGGGEPTLHPHLPEALRELARRNISVGILTNGTKLYGELAELLVDHASYVRIGFDGATEETVHKVKRPRSPEARFDAVCRNFKNMVALRNERGTKCRISVKVVLDQENVHETEACVQLAIELGADSIQFKAARLVDTELTPEQGLEVDEVIRHCQREYAGRVVVIGGTEKIDAVRQCWLTPLQLVVDAIGDVFLCCYYRHRKDKHTIGNCFESSLHDMWYSEEHWDKIGGIEPKECNNLDCRFVKYNDIMDELIVDNDAQFEFI